MQFATAGTATRLNIRSLGSGGDWLANILEREEYIPVIDNDKPDVFLASGSGNDLVGKQRLMWVLPAFKPGKPPEWYLSFKFASVLDEQRTLWRQLFDQLTTRYPEMKIIGHGYDYGIPDDGDWLGKPMSKARIADPELQKAIVRLLIDRFNEMRIELAGEYHNVTHVDCRGVVSEWHDELHPKSADFGRVAAKILAAIP